MITTDVLLYNLLKVTSDVAANSLDSRTKIKGTFLAEKLIDYDNLICQVDPNWKNSSMNFTRPSVLWDVDDNAVTVV